MRRYMNLNSSHDREAVDFVISLDDVIRTLVAHTHCNDVLKNLFHFRIVIVNVVISVQIKREQKSKIRFSIFVIIFCI